MKLTMAIPGAISCNWREMLTWVCCFWIKLFLKNCTCRLQTMAYCKNYTICSVQLLFQIETAREQRFFVLILMCFIKFKKCCVLENNSRFVFSFWLLLYLILLWKWKATCKFNPRVINAADIAMPINPYNNNGRRPAFSIKNTLNWHTI